MFDQFRTDLGLFKFDPNLPGPLAKQIFGQKTAVAEAVNQAQTRTAEVTIMSASKVGGMIQADVQVQNLAGHNFPSGVNFRRAFLNFQVLDAGGNVLWASGNTNADGVIVDNAGNPLPTEFFSPSQQTFQPHFWTGNPITSDSQVENLRRAGDRSTRDADDELPESRSQGERQSHPAAGKIVSTAPTRESPRPLAPARPELSTRMRLQHRALPDTAARRTPPR